MRGEQSSRQHPRARVAEPALARRPLYAEPFANSPARETTLERHRPGYKRWGPKWITQAEFDDTRRRIDDLMAPDRGAGRVVRRITLTVTTLTDQYNTAATRARGFSNHVHVRRYNDPIVINSDAVRHLRRDGGGGRQASGTSASI
jgi:hypothetical protein